PSAACDRKCPTARLAGIFPPPTLYNKVAAMAMNEPHSFPSPESFPGLCAMGPDLMDLAAYADGKASDQLRQSIEAHLVECDACRAAVDDAVQQRLQQNDVTMILVAPAVIEAAAALVMGDRVAQGAPQTLAPKSARLSMPWITIVRRGVAAAALVAICFAGY